MKITSYKDKNNKTYYQVKGYIGTDPITNKKKSISKRGFKKKRDAELYFNRLKMNFGKGCINSKERMTFAEVTSLWLSHYENTVKESTYQIQKDVIRLHIEPQFGNMSIEKINTAYCQQQVDNWFSYYQKYNNLIGLTKRIFDYAISHLKLINENPMKNIESPKRKNDLKEDKYEAPYYNAQQLSYFMDCVQSLDEPQTYAMFRILAYTGVRQGELLGLKFKDFDEINNTLTIERTISRGKDYKTNIQSPKSIAGYRTIPLDNETARILRYWKHQQKELLFKFGHNANSPDQYIFTNENNNHQYSGYAYAKLKTIRKKFAIDPITIHGLRHTFCTLQLEAGASIKEVQELMGHENTDMVLSTYSHINKENKSKLGNNFADYIEKSVKSR